MKTLKSILLLCLVCCSCSDQESNSNILFVSFKDPGNTGIWFALSDDALNYQAINGGKPVIPSNDSIRTMRDPFIARDVESGYHLVWTTGKQKIGYAWSPDLIDWSKQRIIPIDYENDSVINTWAPELIYDENRSEWLVIYSSTILGEFPETKGQVRNGKNHRIYAVSTKDFVTISEPTLFFDPGYPVIDATIIKENDSYFMVYKDERDYPLKKLLKSTVSKNLTGQWKEVSDSLTESWSEGPSVIHWANKYYLYYDFYSVPRHMGLLVSEDKETWKDISYKTTFPTKYKHGSFLVLTNDELQNLQSAFMPLEANLFKMSNM